MVGNDVNLVYMDTDIFLLEFKNVDAYREMQNWCTHKTYGPLQLSDQQSTIK